MQFDSPRSEGLLPMIERYLQWVRRYGYASYDWQDLWAGAAGRVAKQVYQRVPIVGALMVAPLMLCDLYWPGCRRGLARKRVHPISLAHMGQGFLNLHAFSGDRQFLVAAQDLVQPLLREAVPSGNGFGWGMKFDWTARDGVVPADTPCHTQTAYGYDFLAAMQAIQEEPQLEGHLRSIAAHTSRDFNEWRQAGRLASSYSTLDHRRVVNANSYRMAILLDAATRFSVSEYADKGLETLEYVLSMQASDGSWPYSEDEPFVDTFHTCFVLKNLSRVRNASGINAVNVEQAIDRGMAYYRDHLVDEKGLPRPFAVAPRITLQRHDSYDLAESIGLLSRMRVEPRLLAGMLEYVRHSLQTADGWFRFRVYRVPTPQGIPYMRWANSAMFLALTEALLTTTTATQREA
jgi:hypothetical protein